MAFPVIRTRQTGNAAEDRARDDITSALATIIQSRFVQAFLSGVAVEGVDLGVGSQSIAHSLGRQPVGYLVTWAEGAAPAFHVTDSDTKRLTVTSTAASTVDLWVW